jgi:hypothetical protein
MWVRDALATHPGGGHARARGAADRLTLEVMDCRQRLAAAEQRIVALEQELAAVKASRTWRTAEQVQRIRRRLTWKQ